MENDRGLRVASIIQNRANEVGIAFFEESTRELRLHQFVEVTRTYRVTVASLLAFEPSCLIIVDTKSEQPVNRAIVDAIQDFGLLGKACDIRNVKRSAFDDTKGHTLVNKFTRTIKREKDEVGTNAANYLSFGAAGKSRGLLPNVGHLHPALYLMCLLYLSYFVEHNFAGFCAM